MTRPNPLLPGFHPDPTICRVGSVWYLVTSTFEYFPGLPIYRSEDLSTWELVGHAVQRRERFDLSGVKGSGGMFAPTLRYSNGRFFLVCTLMHGQGPAGSFVVTTTDPAGTWSDPVWLPSAPGIDPSLFFDDDGTAWYLGCDLNPVEDAPEQTDLWLQQFDPDRLALTGLRHVVSNGALRGARWAEGPHLYRVDGTYYLLHAEGGTERNHAVMISKASHVTGPYIGNPGNPVLTHRHLGRSEPMYGVGHADLTTDASGRWWAVALAMRTFDGTHHLLGRETVIVPVEWEDGWPIFAPGAGRVPNEVDLPAGTFPGAGPVLINGDRSPDGSWVQLRTGASFWSHDGRGLHLTGTDATLRDRGTPAFLAHRLQHPNLDVHAKIELRSPGTAGICLYQSERFHHLVGVQRGTDGSTRLQIVTVRDGTPTVIASRPIVDGTAAEVSVQLRGGSLRASVTHGGTSAVAELDPLVLSTEHAGGFVGTMIGPFVEGRAASAVFSRVALTPVAG